MTEIEIAMGMGRGRRGLRRVGRARIRRLSLSRARMLLRPVRATEKRGRRGGVRRCRSMMVSRRTRTRMFIAGTDRKRETTRASMVLLATEKRRGGEQRGRVIRLETGKREGKRGARDAKLRGARRSNATVTAKPAERLSKSRRARAKICQVPSLASQPMLRLVHRVLSRSTARAIRTSHTSSLA